ncbi:MAG: tetratricopeptide repeat protein [Methylophilaceae bacterium]
MAAAPGRNNPCPCGSGKKFKQCCLNKHQSTADSLDQQLQHALRLAHAHFQHGHNSQAATVCHQIIQILPGQPDARHLLGAIELRQGNIELAITHFQHVLKVHPHHPEYLGNLGFAYHEKGELDAALHHYARALQVAPDYVNVLYNQHALLLKDNRSAAIENLNRLLRITPSDNEVHYMLGVLLETAGETDAAQMSLDAIKNGSPLDQARLDAWQYIKSANQLLPPITGSMIDTFRLAMDAAPKDGMDLEFGVRFGNSIRQIASIADQQVYGFDSFEGLPEVWHHEPKGSYTTKGEIPTVPKSVQLHVGWFEDTLPRFLERHEGPVRFINVDCDIYSSTKTVLDLLAPRMVPGSVIVFDEYIGNEHWREDEFKAFQESVVRYGWTYEYLCFSVFTKQVAVRINSV